LWYEKLRTFLVRLGYEQSETDSCVFREVVGVRIKLIMVYEEDLLTFVTQAKLKSLKSVFTNEFRWITLDIGKTHSYLGLLFKEGRVKVDMSYYLDKVFREFTGLKAKVLPGKKNLSATSLDLTPLPEKEKQSFHTMVAKLLYLSRRA
jgi:hypothetical protein